MLSYSEQTPSIYCTCCGDLILELLAAEHLVYVHELVAVVSEVQTLLVPVVQVDVKVRSI